jgi:hypothetical protein
MFWSWSDNFQSSNERIAYANFDMIFNKFDVLVKIFTNQYTKFHDEFQELCEKTLINHCMIS